MDRIVRAMRTILPVIEQLDTLDAKLRDAVRLEILHALEDMVLVRIAAEHYFEKHVSDPRFSAAHVNAEFERVANGRIAPPDPDALNDLKCPVCGHRNGGHGKDGCMHPVGEGLCRCTAAWRT